MSFSARFFRLVAEGPLELAIDGRPAELAL